MALQKLNVSVPVGTQPLAQQIFYTANSFHEGGIRCAESVSNGLGGTVSPTSPMITCYAMAVELYLKSLMTIEQGKAIQGHRLNVLFAKIKSDTQLSIINRFDVLAGTGPGDFTYLIGKLSSAFVEWRYIFEDVGERQIPVSALVYTAQSLYAEISSRAPDWLVDAYSDARLRAPPAQIVVTVVSGGGGSLRRAIAVPKV